MIPLPEPTEYASVNDIDCCVGHTDAAMSAYGDACAADALESAGWMRAVDEAMVVHHIGVADETDDYATAKDKLNKLLCNAQSIGEYFALDVLKRTLPALEHWAAICNSDEEYALLKQVKKYVGEGVDKPLKV